MDPSQLQLPGSTEFPVNDIESTVYVYCIYGRAQVYSVLIYREYMYMEGPRFTM